jgi:hypothetical protein
LASWDVIDLEDLLQELQRRKEISSIDDVINLIEEITQPFFDDSYYRSLIEGTVYETGTN